MKLRGKISSFMVVFLFLMLAAMSGMVQAGETIAPLNILLSNDDGYSAPGIQAMREALLTAGHQVILVAPLTNQSGTGTTTTLSGFVAVEEHEPGVWSVDGTPADSVHAGVSAIFAGQPPDLIISGANFGQNLSQQMAVLSGTVGAALVGMYRGIPAIAVNVGILLSERKATPLPYPSTYAAFPRAADFIVRLVEKLQRTSHDGRLLPRGVVLNVNFPVPYDQIQGVKLTPLEQENGFEIVYLDVNGVLPTGGGPLMISAYPLQPVNPDPRADMAMFNQGFISISLLEGNWTASTPVFDLLKHRLFKIEP
jgi:5'-nucleotidase